MKGEGKGAIMRTPYRHSCLAVAQEAAQASGKAILLGIHAPG